MKTTYSKLAAAIAFSVTLLILVGVVMASIYQLSGTVKNQASVPFAGATVEVVNPSNGTVVASTTTDSTGYYTLSVDAGTYSVRVTPPAGSGFQTSIALNRVISGNTILDFVLVPSGSGVTLSGRILDRFGNGQAGQNLYLYPGGNSSPLYTTTDSTGAYSYQVAPGDYRLTAYFYDYAGANSTSPRYYDFGTSIFTLSANTIADITLPTYRVSVHVQDPAGNAVPNTALSTSPVYADSLSLGPFAGTGSSGYQNYLPPVVTNSSGDATLWLFPNYPYGSYTFNCAPPSGSPFVTFNISNVNVASDKSLVVVLQFIHDAPVTTASLSPSPDSYGTYCGATTVTLSATAFSGFTVAATHYTVDGGPTQTYTSPFTISGGGPHSISYWSVDNVGVFEITNTRSFTINSNPVVTITGPASGSIYVVNTPVNFTGTFTDAGGGTHTAQWTFDGSSQAGTINESTGAVSAVHTFTTSGVYMVGLAVTDSCSGTGTTSTVGGLDALVVIYDPDGGFVTGGGWINSPAGAYVPSPTLTGKANFGFVSKYQHGANVPTGQTEFQFRVANFNFHSTAYDWLVVAGARAQYKGTGTVNGSGNYAFILTAIDGQINGGGGIDKFRIKIWDKATGAIIYDNQLGAADGGDPSTVLGGGSIVIHN